MKLLSLTLINFISAGKLEMANFFKIQCFDVYNTKEEDINLYNKLFISDGPCYQFLDSFNKSENKTLRLMTHTGLDLADYFSNMLYQNPMIILEDYWSHFLVSCVLNGL